MRAPVVLDDQAVVRVIEVGPSEEGILVADRNLDLRAGKTCKNQKKSQPGLHWALAGCVHVVGVGDRNVLEANHSLIEGSVEHDNRLDKLELRRKVGQGPWRRGHTQALAKNDVIGRELPSPDRHPRPSRYACRRRNGRLDDIASRVETVKEGSCGPGESSCVWETQRGGF